MKKRAALVVLVAAGAVGWYAFAGGDEDVAWTRAEVRDLVIDVDVEGTLASRDASVLRPPQVPNFYDFKISMMAPEGTEVPQGTPILAFDTTDLQQQLLTQQNAADQAAKNIEKQDADLEQQLMGQDLQLAEARATLRRAELKADVPDDLRAANEAQIAALDLEVARKEVEGLERQIGAARDAGAARRAALVAQRDRAANRVREIEDSIAEMTLTAPRPGTVIYVQNWRGEKKKIGDNAWRNERLIELPDLTRMMARGEVDEADAGRLAVGQPVTFRLDAHPDLQFTGRIESIWRTVQRKSGSRNPLKVVRLDIALDETDVERMRPGMRFQGRVEIERIEDALVIPARAAAPTADGALVYRSGSFGLEPTPVRLGARGRERVQVLEGLEAGDRIAEIAPAGHR